MTTYIFNPAMFNYEKIRGMNNVIYYIDSAILSVEDFEFLYYAYLRPTAKQIYIDHLLVFKK